MPVNSQNPIKGSIYFYQGPWTWTSSNFKTPAQPVERDPSWGPFKKLLPKSWGPARFMCVFPFFGCFFLLTRDRWFQRFFECFIPNTLGFWSNRTTCAYCFRWVAKKNTNFRKTCISFTLPLKLTATVRPWKVTGTQKETIVFQPSRGFRGGYVMLVSGRVFVKKWMGFTAPPCCCSSDFLWLLAQFRLAEHSLSPFEFSGILHGGH